MKKEKTKKTNPVSIQIDRNREAILTITQDGKTGYAHNVVLGATEVRTRTSENEMYPFEITLKFYPVLIEF